MMHDPGCNRRQFLAGVSGTGLLGLAGCQTAQPGGGGAAASTTVVQLPDAIAQGGLVYDVRPAGYVAEEFLFAGTAPIYPAVDMADAADMSKRDMAADMARRDFTLKQLGTAPYRTRVVVYRPADPARWNGRLIVEPAHPIGGGVLSVFGFMNDVFLADGNIHVSVAVPINFVNLKASDPARYGTLQAADPTQIWGMLRDVGAALKQGSALLPASYPVRRMMMTGYSWTGVATATFANFHHIDARLANGRPIYDAYLPMANATYVRDLDVPVLRFNTQSEFDVSGGLGNRKPDSDAPGSQFRLYEMAGASHGRRENDWPGKVGSPKPLRNFVYPVGLPTGGDRCSAGFPQGSQPNDFPLHHYAAAAFENLWLWIERGTAPPPGALITVDGAGHTVFDRFGNARGGLRSSELDVPDATFGVGPKNAGICGLVGYRMNFAPARMRTLYGTPARYRQHVAADVARLQSERRLRPREAGFILATAATRQW